jgi:hypothetical protein
MQDVIEASCSVSGAIAFTETTDDPRKISPTIPIDVNFLCIRKLLSLAKHQLPETQYCLPQQLVRGNGASEALGKTTRN